MTKNKKKYCFMLFLCLFAFSVLGASVKWDKTPAKAHELTTESEVLSSYKLGSKFTVPKASISYDGTNYEASHILFFPDGTPYVKDVYDLTATGEYTLSYESTINRRTVSVDKTFVVYSDAYDVSVNTVLEYKDSLEKVESSSVSGISVSLPENDVFTFNEPINVYDFNDERPLICIHPYNNGGEGTTQREVLRHIVRLTDCYDSKNYIDFILAWDYSDHKAKTAAMFYRASVAGGKSIGLRTTAQNSGFKYNDQYYIIRESLYGAASPQYQLTDAGVTVFFDPIENTFYAEGISKVLVSKLDSDELYGAEAFSGFTTGEVYLSVFAEEYYESIAHIEISSLGGYNQKELHMTGVFDKKKPDIVIASGFTDETVYIAKNESVTLPKANVYDVNWNNEISVAVYSNYGTDNCKQVSCKNGVFTPTRAGVYTVEYIARDTFGNTATRLLEFRCVITQNDKSIDFEVDELEELTAGTICKLPDYSATSLNGKVDVEEFFRVGSDGEKTPVPTEGFLVEYIGEYQIIYEYTDGYFTYEKVYSVSSKASDNITFDTPILPEYFIADANYTLDTVYAYTYKESDPVRHDVTVYMIKDSDEKSATKVDYDNVKIPNCSAVSFKYVYGEQYVYSYEVSVVDVGFASDLKMEDYFIGDFEKSSDGIGIYYSSNKSSGSNTLQFANIVSLSSFSFACTVENNLGNLAAIDISLTDYYDRSKSVTISYINNSGVTVFASNRASINTQRLFEGYEHKFYYSESDEGFYDISGNFIAWDNSFASDKILLSVTLRGISGRSKIKITEVCGTVFSNDTDDFFKPILFYENMGGFKKKGETVTISSSYAIDVLCPFLRSDLNLTVMSPSAKTVVSKDGVTLNSGCATDCDYLIELTEYGKYRVIYSYTDARGNTVTESYFVNVEDDTPPSIELDDDYGKNSVVYAALNDKITLKGYIIFDDKTAESALVVKTMVYSPSLEHVFVKDNAFTVTKKGIYTVCYYVYDEFGNYSTVSYKVMVK